MEPHINTIDMEAVITFGQNPTSLSLLKLRQANGAFQHLLLLVIFSLLLVGEGGERFEDKRVEAASRDRDDIGRIRGLDVKDKMCAAASTADLTAARSEEVPTSVDV